MLAHARLKLVVIDVPWCFAGRQAARREGLVLAPSCVRLEEAHLPQEGAADGQFDRYDRLEVVNGYDPGTSMAAHSA